MNEPIISPWLFYWAAIADGLRVLFAFGAAASLTIAWEAFTTFVNERRELKWLGIFPDHIREDNSEYKKSRRKHEIKMKSAKEMCKKWLVVGFVFVLVALLTPSETTIYRMAAANYITPQNIEVVVQKTGKAIDGGIDYMIDKIVEAADKWEARKGD